MSHSSFMYYWGASSGHVFSTWEGQNNFPVSFLNNGQAYNGDIFPNCGRKSEDLNLAYDLLFQGIVQFVSDLLATSPTPCPTLMLHLFCCPYYQHWCYNNCTLFPWIKLWILEMIHHFFEDMFTPFYQSLSLVLNPSLNGCIGCMYLLFSWFDHVHCHQAIKWMQRGEMCPIWVRLLPETWMLRIPPMNV